MADSIKDFVVSEDGSATLGVIFDVSGMGFDSALTDNWTPFSLAARTDGAAWTQDTAIAALAGEIAAAREAFLIAAPNFIPPDPPVGE